MSSNVLFLGSKPSGAKSVHRCNVCNAEILGSSYHFKAHMYQHEAVEPRHQCSFCPKKFFRKDLYKKHVLKHEGHKPKPSFECDDCGRCFVEKRNLQQHLKVHDDNLRLEYKCVACDATYCEQRLLKYHIRKTHYNLDVPNNSTHLRKRPNDTWLERTKGSDVCVQITKVNNNMLLIQKIGDIKTEDVKKEVPETEDKTKQEYYSSIFAKKDITQYSKARCDYCQKEMLKKSLRFHIRERHLKLKKFKCDVCSRSFARHYQLVDHVCGKDGRRRRKVAKKKVQ